MKAWMSLNLTLVSALVLSACAPAQNANRTENQATSSDEIIGGSVVTPNDPITKSIVGLVIIPAASAASQTSRGPAAAQSGEVAVEGCTGTLISSNVILTAAHCVVSASRIMAYFGRSFAEVQNTPAKIRAATRIVVKRGFSLSRDKDENDIALIQLNAAAPAGYAPATMLSSVAALQNGSSVKFAGYGVTGMTDAGQSQSMVLRQVSMRIEDSAFAPTEILFDQRAGRGACHGDSGGPAYMVDKGQVLVLGVTSRGYSSDQDQVSQAAAVACQAHVVYTSVPAHLNWIRTVALPGLNSMTNGQMRAL